MLVLAFSFLSTVSGTSLVAQWLGFCASTVGGAGSIPAQGAKERQKKGSF